MNFVAHIYVDEEIPDDVWRYCAVTKGEVGKKYGPVFNEQLILRNGVFAFGGLDARYPKRKLRGEKLMDTAQISSGIYEVSIYSVLAWEKSPENTLHSLTNALDTQLDRKTLKIEDYHYYAISIALFTAIIAATSRFVFPFLKGSRSAIILEYFVWAAIIIGVIALCSSFFLRKWYSLDNFMDKRIELIEAYVPLVNISMVMHLKSIYSE